MGEVATGKLRSRIWERKTAAAKTFGPKCSPAVLTLKPHPLEFFAEILKCFQNFLLTEAEPF